MRETGGDVSNELENARGARGISPLHPEILLKHRRKHLDSVRCENCSVAQYEMLLTWDTLLFVLPIALAIVLGAGALTGLVGEVELDLDTVDVDVDIDVDADADGDGDGEAHSVLAVLAWLGLGRAPLTVLLTIGLLTFGGTGLALRGSIGPILALAVALVLSPLATSVLGRTIGRYMPTSETYVQTRGALVGCSGFARLPVTGEFGVAQVTDDGGTLRQIRCRIEESDESIDKGGPLVVVDYDETSRTYTVAPISASIST